MNASISCFMIGLLSTVVAAQMPPTVGVKGAVGCGENPKLVQRLEIKKPGIYENYLVDGEWAESNLVKVMVDDVTLRHCEIRNGRHNGIVVYAAKTVIESCRIHHLLNGSFTDQQDAHGITGRPQNLTIRNCEIYYVSGDALQFDPGRGPWDNVTVENCTFWTGPLPEDAGGFNRGERPGENGVDTKQGTNNPRSRLILRNCVFYGWNQPAQVGSVAALNLKNHVEVTVENCVFHDNEICFRLRGPGDGGKFGGAKVSISDCTVHDSGVAIRMEDRIEDLKIRRLGLGQGIKQPYVSAGGGVGSGFVNEGVFSAPPVESQILRPQPDQK